MKTFAFVLLSCAAGCASDGDDDRPIVTQPGLPPPSSSAVSGRVCVGSDLRDLGSCSSLGAGGFTVTLDGATTTTAADGSFSLPLPSTSLEEFTVSGTSALGMTIVPTTSAFTTPFVLPAIDAELYQSILLAYGVTPGDGTGSLLVNVTRGNLAAAGVTVTSNPNGAAGPFYGGTSSTVWNTTGTGDTGSIMIPGIVAGSVDLSYQTILGGLETQVNGVTVRNGGVTILSTQLPGSGTP